MKKFIYSLLVLTTVFLFSSCSSVNVLNSWKSDTADAVKDNNILVIARTANMGARVTFENEIVKELTARNMKATASFTKFPKLNPDQQLTKGSEQEIKKLLLDNGFDGVVLTVIKEKQELMKTVTDGGYNAGGNYYGYYPRYYGGFYGYFYNPMSYHSLGNYVPETTTTRTSKLYILETTIYDLNKTGENQLVAVVTSQLDNPESAGLVAPDFVKKIAASLK